MSYILKKKKSVEVMLQMVSEQVPNTRALWAQAI
jgi:hypothetical protein